MEVRCVHCGLFFSIDDHVYKGEYENFCSLKCQRAWRENKIKKEDVTPEETLFTLPTGEKG